MVRCGRMGTKALCLVALLALFGLEGRSQSLSIPAVTAKAGSTASFLLKLDSAPGTSPVAVQWKFSFPRGVAVAASDILAGSAAESAKKSMTCALENDPKQPTLAIFLCILAGGEQLIPNGTIATVRYRLAN